MEKLITGIHHITAIAGVAQKNIDFYSGILGIRLVKKTVNFDAPDVYHFYYGDELGNPGTLITFFPYGDLVRGRHGKGMLNTTKFSVSTTSLQFWLDRFKKFGILHKDPDERFNGEIVVYFEDIDGLGLELVFSDKDKRPGFSNGTIPLEYSIKGFYSAEIWLEGYERTAALLSEQMDHKLIEEKGNRFRFAASDEPGNYIDLVCSPDSMRGLSGNGTVHHIAFATPDKTSQEEVRIKIWKSMLNPTPIIDRDYFTSIYFREPGGVLFEVATSGPGFLIDESKEELGKTLKLPKQYEGHRSELERTLTPIVIDQEKFK